MNVYLVCAEISGEKLYKIGFTRREINQRIKELKTGNVADFSIIDSFRSKWGTKIEALLHKNFKSKKVNGEWFLLEDSDIRNFRSLCESTHNNLEVVSQTSYYLERGKF